MLADAAGVAEAEMVLAEMRKVQAEIDAMMEYEMKLRDLQPGNFSLSGGRPS